MTVLKSRLAILAASAVLLAGLSAAVALAQDVRRLTSSAADEPSLKRPEPAASEASADVPGDVIATKNPIQIIRQGGLMMYGLLACSIVSLVFVFERTISLRRGRVIPSPFVKRLMHQLRDGQLDREQALRLCTENKSPVARVLAGAIRKWGRPSVEVEQALIDAGERVTNELRRYLRVFNGVATVSPLLGLLGTVFGMIRAFNDIAHTKAMGRPELLAGGISEALLCTAFGLAVAIPAMIFYWMFVSLVDRRVVEIDALGEELVPLIAGDVPHEVSPAKALRSRRREPTADVSAP